MATGLENRLSPKFSGISSWSPSIRAMWRLGNWPKFPDKPKLDRVAQKPKIDRVAQKNPHSISILPACLSLKSPCYAEPHQRTKAAQRTLEAQEPGGSARTLNRNGWGKNMRKSCENIGKHMGQSWKYMGEVIENHQKSSKIMNNIKYWRCCS